MCNRDGRLFEQRLGVGITDAMGLTHGDTVKTRHTATEIHIFGFQANTTGLAMARTLDTENTSAFGNLNLEQR